MPSRPIFLTTLCLAFVQLGRLCAQTSPETTFQEQLQPIIFKNCNGCHTFGGHAGELRMDSYAAFMKGGERGVPVVAGQPGASILLRAIQYNDPDLKMPPRGKLSDSDIAVVEKWIRGFVSEPKSSEPAPTNLQTKVFSPAAKGPEPLERAANTPSPILVADKATPEQEQFFEAKIRPLLSKNCYGCHATAANGGLRLDSREALLKGGKDGPVVVVGHPESSLLISALHYKSALQMPPAGALKIITSNIRGRSCTPVRGARSPTPSAERR